MQTIGIVGFGYVGAALATRLVEANDRVIGLRRDPTAAGPTPWGVEVLSADLDIPETLSPLGSCDAIVHLAPPPDDEQAIVAQARALAAASPKARVVYGSTTGVFGERGGAWTDERSTPGTLGTRGARRVRAAQALTQAGLDVARVYIPGIYGPGRSMFDSLARGIVLFDDGPETSRVHVDDLVEVLRAQLGPKRVPEVIACDEFPATTLEVARYACAISGAALPDVLTKDEAVARMSPLARELRLGGRRCRSLYRASLVPELRFPSYRDGLASIWEARGADHPIQ